MANRFDKFSPGARNVLIYAQEESLRFKHNYLGPEHILLALLHDRDEIAATVLRNLNVEADKVRDSIEMITGLGSANLSGEKGVNPRAKKVIELSVEEALRLNHNYVDTGHLLLAILREGQSPAFAILQSMGVNLERARTEMARIYSENLLQEPESPATKRDFVLAETSQPPAARPDIRRQSPQRFDRFTESARRAFTFAQEEFFRSKHNYVGSEHILLGLTRVEDGVAARVMANLGVSFTQVRAAVEATIGHGTARGYGEAGLSADAKKVIELAVDEVRRLNHSYVSTEHLLVGLLSTGEGVAFGVLTSLGLTLDRVRPEIVRILSESPRTGPGFRHVDPADPEFGTGPSVTDIGALRTAPNAELRDTAIGLLREAKSALDAMAVDGLAKAFVEMLVMPAVTRLIDLMDLQTFNRQEYEDGNTRIKQSLDVLNAATEAIQPFDPEASTALMTASAAVQRALAR